MEKINTVTDLKKAIHQLEHRQSVELGLLKDQVLLTYENLKPINILKNSLKNAISSPDLKNNIINTALGVTTGFVAKKIAVGNTHNPITKLLGTVLEIMVASKVSQNAE